MTARAAIRELPGGDVRVSLLRGFELRRGPEVVRLPLSAQRLLAFLALHDRPLLRPYVAGTLWLESSQEHANANLRTALWRLRRPGCRVVSASPDSLALERGVAVDLRDAELIAHRAIEHAGRPDDLAELRTTGDLLPDWYDDWLLIERERFRQLRLHALEVLCEDLAAAGSFAAAAEAGLAAVAGEPLRESAHRALIKAYLAEGNVGEAVRQYEVFRRVMLDELGLEPSPLIQELVRPFAPPRGRAAPLPTRLR
jgi:DNA-binding SARP family transcriptional activator